MKMLVLLMFSWLQYASIYNYAFQDINGNQVALNGFRGKKIMFVNIATGSNYASQLDNLEKLHEKFNDKLTIIAFPSNDFGNENRSDFEIKKLLTSKYKARYLVASKGPVTGINQSAVYEWLSKASLNGTLNSQVKGDFYKYLIDDEGRIMGVFAGRVDPMNESIQNAIIN